MALLDSLIGGSSGLAVADRAPAFTLQDQNARPVSLAVLTMIADIYGMNFEHVPELKLVAQLSRHHGRRGCAAWLRQLPLPPHRLALR